VEKCTFEFKIQNECPGVDRKVEKVLQKKRIEKKKKLLFNEHKVSNTIFFYHLPFSELEQFIHCYTLYLHFIYLYIK